MPLFTTELTKLFISLILDTSSVLIKKVLSFEVCPFSNSNEDLGTLNCFDKNSMTALLALPSTGCAVILTLRNSSVFIISFLDALGDILKVIVILMNEIILFYLKNSNKICIMIIS